MEQYSMTEVNMYIFNILQILTFVYFQDERSRHKYLNHLPLTCEFVLCELDLVPPLVSPRILMTFAGKSIRL